MEAEVRNNTAQPVEFSVVRAVGGALPGGNEIAGAVQPASVPAGPSTTKVIFYLPTDGEWLINIPGYGEIEGKDFDSFLRLQCRPLSIYFDDDGAWGWPGCAKSVVDASSSPPPPPLRVGLLQLGAAVLLAPPRAALIRSMRLALAWSTRSTGSSPSAALPRSSPGTRPRASSSGQSGTGPTWWSPPAVSSSMTTATGPAPVATARALPRQRCRPLRGQQAPPTRRGSHRRLRHPHPIPWCLECMPK